MTTHNSPALEVVEEHLNITTPDVVTGRVQVALTTQTIEQPVSLSLNRTEVEVVRHEINQTLGRDDPVPQQRTEGGTTIIPVLEEIVVVETRLVLRAEVHVTQVTTAETVSTTVPLRRQTADVTRDADFSPGQIPTGD